MVTLTRPDGTQPQDLHVGRRAAVSIFFAGYAVAALAADAKPIHTPDAGLTVETALIPNGAPKPLPAYVARPKGAGRHATIIVVNDSASHPGRARAIADSTPQRFTLYRNNPINARAIARTTMVRT